MEFECCVRALVPGPVCCGDISCFTIALVVWFQIDTMTGFDISFNKTDIGTPIDMVV